METSSCNELTEPTPLLLDTHIWLWFSEGMSEEFSSVAQDAIEAAARDGRAWVSAISVWEIAMLEQRGVVTLSTELHSWVAASRVPPGIRIAPLSLPVLVDGPRLPAWLKRGTSKPRDRKSVV